MRASAGDRDDVSNTFDRSGNIWVTATAQLPICVVAPSPPPATPEAASANEQCLTVGSTYRDSFDGGRATRKGHLESRAGESPLPWRASLAYKQGVLCSR